MRLKDMDVMTVLLYISADDLSRWMRVLSGWAWKTSTTPGFMEVQDPPPIQADYQTES
jgi:hypothetical protein